MNDRLPITTPVVLINVWIPCWPWPSSLYCRIHIIQRWFRFENIKSSNRGKKPLSFENGICVRVNVWCSVFFILSFSFCCFSPSLTINLLLLAGQFAAFRRFIAHKEENPLNTFALNMNTGARNESNNEFLQQNVRLGAKYRRQTWNRPYVVPLFIQLISCYGSICAWIRFGISTTLNRFIHITLHTVCVNVRSFGVE